MMPVDSQLDNIVLIDLFLENRMSELEKRDFLKRLRKDKQLQADFDLITSELERFQRKDLISKEEEDLLRTYDSYQLNLARKIRTVKQLSRYGLAFVFGALFTLLVSITIMYFAS